MAADKRRIRRQSHATIVIVIAGKRWQTGDLIDYSPTGCRLRLDDPQPLPSTVTLSFPVAGRKVTARNVWRRGSIVGFQFLDAAPGPADPPLDLHGDAARQHQSVEI